MGDPFREGMRRQQHNTETRVGNAYTPIVLWVQTPDGCGEGAVKSRLREIAGDMPFVETPDGYDEPATEVITPAHDTPYSPDADDDGGADQGGDD